MQNQLFLQLVEQFDDLPDFDSMISDYNAVKLADPTPLHPEKKAQIAITENTSSDERLDAVFDPLDAQDSQGEQAMTAEQVETEPVAQPAIEIPETPAVAEAEDGEEWEDFDDFEDIGDDFDVSVPAQQAEVASVTKIADVEQLEPQIITQAEQSSDDFSEPEMQQEPAVEESEPDYIAPVHEDFVQEDSVFTDYDADLRGFDDISDAESSQMQAEEGTTEDDGFDIDFSVFESAPRRQTPPVTEEEPVGGSKRGGGRFRKNKKK